MIIAFIQFISSCFMNAPISLFFYWKKKKIFCMWYPSFYMYHWQFFNNVLLLFLPFINVFINHDDPGNSNDLVENITKILIFFKSDYLLWKRKITYWFVVHLFMSWKPIRMMICPYLVWRSILNISWMV